jgi:hypothetical protein
MKKILIFIFMLLAAIPGIAQHFTTVWTGNGHNQMNINILEAKLSLANLEAGDEIAAFDGSLCVGVVRITGAYTNLSIAVSQVDAGGDGYTPGDPIVLKYWDSSWNNNTGKEVTAIIKDNAGAPYSPIYPVAGVSVFLKLSGITELTINIGANNKTYDGDVLATVPSETVVAHGVVSGQVVSVAVSNARFNTKDIGTGKTVTASVTLSGPDAANYTVNPTVTTTADILAKVITITPGTNQHKVYGASDPALSYTSSPGLIGLDAITGTLGRVANENAGTYAFTLGSLTAGSNYNLQIVGSPSTFEISKAVLTATVADKTKVYGAANPELTFGYSGWVNGTETIDTPPSISTTVTTATGVGPNTGSISLSGGSDNNYTFSFVDGSLAVTKAELTATADDKTKTYGAANPALTLTYSGWGVNGVETVDTPPSINTTVTTATGVGANTGSITLSGGSDNNYTLTLVAGSLAVTKADQTITWADPANIVYNAALSITQLNATVSVPGAEAHGALTYTPALDVILNAGTNQALLVEVAGSSNYNPASKTVHINVTKADQTITWANPADIVYNAALSATQLNASIAGVIGGSATGAVTYVPVSGTVLHAGASQDLIVNVAETSDYNPATKIVKINVNKAEQTITWSDPADIVYGTALSSTQLNASVAGVSGGSATGAVTYVSGSGTVLNAGASQDLTINVAATDDYNAATKTVKINVSKANQTITWSNPSDIVYGTALGGTQLNATVSVPGVEAHGALTYTPASGVKLNAGTNQALLVEVAGSSNYNPASKTVHINVVKADQTITWADPSDIPYSTALSATQLNATVSVSGVEAHGAMTYTPAAGINLNMGASQALLVEVAGSSNYNPASKTVHINVTKADQTITWSNPADIVYGTALSASQLNATVSVPGVEAHGALTYTPALGVKLGAGDAQELKVDVAGSDNYNPATVTVYINVIKANQTITWAAPSAITYGTVLSATQLNASVAGISGGSAAGALTYDPASSTILGYGVHTLSVTAAATVNYFVATTDVQITVNKKTVTAIVTASDKQYDGNNLATIATRSLTAGNVVGADDVTVAGGTATFYNSSVQNGKTVTAINLTLSGSSAVNYQLTSTTATAYANILRKELTLNAFGNNKIYDKTTGTIVNFTDDRVTGEDFTVNYTGNFVDANAGIAKTINVTGIWLSGTNADNYTPPTTATTTADITAKAITVTAAMTSKIYDGGTTSAGVPTVSPALLSGDVANFTQAFDTKAAATGTKNIIATGSVTDGNSGFNYAVTFVPITNATITRKNTTGTITAPNKTYDGNVTATISNYSLSGVIFGDVVTLSGNATFADKVVQNGKTVTASDLTLAGIDNGNYVLTSTTASTTANITSRTLAVTAHGVSRVYDRGDVATVTFTDDRVSGDVITYSYTATFDNMNAGTTKTVSVSGISKSGIDAANYTLSASSGSTTADITQKTLVIDITADSKDYNGTPAAVTHASITSGLITGDVVLASSANGAFNNKNAGLAKAVTADISISGTDVANYTANTTAATTANINTIALVIGITAEDKNYDGTLTAVTHASITSGLITGDAVSVSSANGLFSDINVGANKDVTANVSKSGTDSDNYTANSTATATAAINKANLSVTAVASNIIYGGSAPVVSVTYGSFQNGETSSVLDNVGFTLGTDYTQWNNAGTYHTTISAGTATDNNYNFLPLTTSTFEVTKANAVIAVTPYSVDYNGSAHSATFTAVGIESTPADLTGLMTVSGTTHTNAGTYTGDAWTFAGNTNYNATSGTVNNAIAKIDATIAVTGFSGTYDGAAHGASGTATGLAAVDLGSLLHVASTTHTNVPGGSVAWTFDGDVNYFASSGNAAVTINKANAVIAVTPYSVNYDGTEHTATFTAVGVESTPANLAGLMTVSGTSHTDAGTYASDSWSFAGNTNYNTAGATITNAIAKIDATIAVTGFSGTYDGNAHGIVSSSATGLASLDLGSLLHVDATTYTNVPGGSVAWTFDGNTNYKSASGNATVTINKANLSVTAVASNIIYGGSAPVVSVTYGSFQNGETSSVLDNVGFTLGTDYTQWNNAGTYHTTISAGTATDNNYNFLPLTTSTFEVTKANAVIAVTPYSVDYNGSAHSATFTAVGIESTPADLTGLMTVSGTTHTNAGTYTGDAWTFAGNTNYNATSGTVNNAIAKIDATIAVTGFSGTYDGAAHGASGTATGLAAVDLGSLLHVASTTHTNVPGGSVAWTFDGDVNYFASSGNAAVTINKANAVIAVTPYSVNYDGTEHTATFTAVGVESTPANLAGLMTVSGTSHTDAGTYASDSWSFAGNTNYNTAGATITNAIAKIDATIAVTGFSGTYDGNAHGIVSSSATGLASLDLGSLLHVDATTYTNVPGGLVAWTFDGNTNYKSASGNATVTINKANLTITADNKSKDYGAALPALTVSYTGLLNGAIAPTTLPTISTTGLATSGFGTYPITAAGAADGNYTIAYVAGTLTVNKVALQITSDNKSKIYGDAIPALTLRYTGLVNGDLATATPATATTLATATSPVGTYPITASGAVDANYNISYTGSTLAITVRDLHLFTFAANSKVYNGNKIATGMGWQDDRIGNDELSFDWNAEFDSKNIGDRSVVYTNIVLFAGANKDNYHLATTSGTATAIISKRELAITPVGIDKVYDGTATATVTLSDNRVSGDIFTSTYTAATFDNMNVATGKPVSVSGISSSGTDFGNYNTNITTTTTAAITRKELTITGLTAQNKDFDSNNTATVTGTAILSGVVSPEEITLAGTPVATFASASAGNDIAVSVSGYTISGATISNYTLVQPTGLKANIMRSIQNINLSQGWNIISFNVLPSDLNLKAIFQPLIDAGKLVKVMNESGLAIENFGGSDWLNFIGNSASTEGYKVKVSSATAMTVQGTALVLPIDIALKTGWNIISFPNTSAQNAKDAVQSLIDAGKLVKVMDETGRAIDYFGSSGWLNFIGDFSAGKGYKVKVNGDCTLTITDNGPKSAEIIPQVLASYHFRTINQGNGYEHMNVNLIDLSSSGIQPGDEIGIFDGSNCVGSALIEFENIALGKMSIPVSSNDGLTQAVTGFISNNTLSLKIYRNEHESKLTFTTIDNAPKSFEQGSSLFIKVSAESATEITDLVQNLDFNCYPNPFTEELTVEINSVEGKILNIEIYDVLGRKITDLYHGISTGSDLIKWNGTNSQGSRVIPGIYYVRCNGQASNGIIKK